MAYDFTREAAQADLLLHKLQHPAFRRLRAIMWRIWGATLEEQKVDQP